MQRFAIFLILLLSSVGLKAQFSVGVRQGYGIYGMYLEPPSIMEYQVPYYQPNMGLIIVFNNINNAGLQTEINYAHKGWKEQDTAVSGSYFIRQIDYLEVPILSHWEMGYGKVRFLIFAGPFLSYKLGESIDSENYTHIWNADHPYNHYEQEIRDIGFGIKLGLGLRYNITPRFGIYIDGRYDLQVAGARDIFIDRPNGIQASRLKEIGGSFGILWHIISQTKKEVKEGYKAKEDLFETY